jgi:cell division protein FtsL
MAQVNRTTENFEIGFARPSRPAPASWRLETARPYSPRVREPLPPTPIQRPETKKEKKARIKAEKHSLENIRVNSVSYQYVSPKQKMSWLTLIILFVAIPLIVSIAMSAINASIQNDINKLNASIASAKEDINDIKIEIRKSSDTGEIEKRAKGELGMVYPNASQIVYISDIKAEAKAAAKADAKKAAAGEDSR